MKLSRSWLVASVLMVLALVAPSEARPGSVGAEEFRVYVLNSPLQTATAADAETASGLLDALGREADRLVVQLGAHVAQQLPERFWFVPFDAQTKMSRPLADADRGPQASLENYQTFELLASVPLEGSHVHFFTLPGQEEVRALALRGRDVRWLMDALENSERTLGFRVVSSDQGASMVFGLPGR